MQYAPTSRILFNQNETHPFLIVTIQVVRFVEAPSISISTLYPDLNSYKKDLYILLTLLS